MMMTDVSSKLAKTLCNYTNQEQQEDYVRYGLEIILGGLLKLFIILTISEILGIVDIMLAAFLTFAIFRSFTGGHHYSTYGRCLIVGLITMLLISFGAIKLTNFLLMTIYWLYYFYHLSMHYFLHIFMLHQIISIKRLHKNKVKNYVTFHLL
ncbi:accessory gene regulator B family protein [Anaerobacillus sp. HL2]|nr:accessory gene regulator B family protein [Anaerobacillus sp. HL2]